jgi:hypothetical protein
MHTKVTLDRRDKGKGFWRRKLLKFRGLKHKQLVIYRSQVELDYAYLLEHDSLVISYKPQPFKIRYMLDGKFRRYTPDFLVEMVGKRLVVEVKPKGKAEREDFQALFHVIYQICRREGYEFIVATDEVIRVQPKLNNIKRLYRYAKIPVEPQLQFLSKEFFLDVAEAAISEVAAFLTSKGVSDSLSKVYGLVYWGYLEVDMMKEVMRASKVRFPGRA